MGYVPRPCAMRPQPLLLPWLISPRMAGQCLPSTWAPDLGSCSCPRQGFYCERSSPFRAFGEVKRLGQDLPQGLCKLGKRS